MKEERISKLFATRVVDVLPSGCQIWTGSVNSHGYGVIRDGERKVRAHRVSWERAHGPIPDGMGVLHKCDVRSCVNPDHLFIGTQAENMRDMGRKGRARGGARGEKQGAAKLTEADVVTIRALAPTMPRKEIAAMFGVDVTNIGIIVNRKGWRHVS